MQRITNAPTIFDSNSCSNNLAIFKGACVYFYEDNAATDSIITMSGTNGIANSVWSSN